jgi:cytochrome d ubiquinol oxidase subunit I
VAVVHIAFQVMVGCGLILVGVSLWSIWILIRKRQLNRPFLWTVTLTAPLGFMALEAGWVVTEVGRQPWIIYDIMRTQDAVTPMPGLWVPLVAFAALYLMLAVMVVALLTRLFQTTKSL